MKIRLMLVALMLVLVGCEEKSNDDTPAREDGKKSMVPSKSELKKQQDDNVERVLENKGPQWKVTYSGDLKGELEGGILVVISVGDTTTARGAGMSKDRKSKAKAAISARVSQYAKDKPPTAVVTLTLPDGTKCVEVTKEDPKRSEVEVIDADSKTYHAKLTGELGCGDDKAKTIQYEAVLNKGN